MSDEFDLASDLEILARDAMVAKIRNSITSIPKSKNCLQCQAETSNGARWCNRGCRDDFVGLRALK